MTKSLPKSHSHPLGKGAMGSARVRGVALRASPSRFDRGSAAYFARGAKSAMAGALGAAALSLCCLLLATAPGRAQSPSADAAPTAPASLPGLVQPFEINRIVRDAGFLPLGPPQREGTTYVLRAIDSREILMRVVVDGRSGAIRAVNRIVPARPDGVVGKMPPPGAPPSTAPPNKPLPGPPSGSPPRDAPAADAMPADITPMSPKEADLSMPPPPLTMRPRTYPAPLGAPPLPRPRPSNLTMQAKPPGRVPKAPAVKPSAAPAAASVAPAAPRRAPVTPNGVPQIATPD
jgi:hypothetical protein